MRSLVTLLGSLVLAVFTRLRPHRWLPPAISLRILRLFAEYGSADVAAALRAQVPAGDRTVRHDLSYAPGRDGLFDLVLPVGRERPPLIVWLHGGGGYFGSGADPLPYAELLGRHGFAVACPNYPRIPEHRFPAAPLAVVDAVSHLRAAADEYGFDPDRIVLAGDSAGAQLAAATAIAWTSPEYAAALGITQVPPPAALRGTALFCGTLNARALADVGRVFTATLASAMWAQAGTRHWERSSTADLMNLEGHLTPAFPPTFLRGGDLDPLTPDGTVAFGERLRHLGVAVDGAVVPGPHQVQFELGSAVGQEILEDLLGFLARVSTDSH